MKKPPVTAITFDKARHECKFRYKVAGGDYYECDGKKCRKKNCDIYVFQEPS